MALINEDSSESGKYVPTRRFNIQQSREPILSEAAATNFKQISRCKSNGDVASANMPPNNDQSTEFKRIYENEFSMRLRAKSVDKAFVNRAQNDYTTNSMNKNFNCPLNHNLGKQKFLLV